MKIKKFIIVGNTLIIGMVEFHFQLIPKGNKESVIGGGCWEWKKDQYPGKIFFFGKSHEFGQCTEQQIRDAWDSSYISPFLENCKIIYSQKDYFMQILIEKGL